MHHIQTQRSALLLLPLEIRTIIWEYLLTGYEFINIGYTTTPSPIPDNEGKPQLQKSVARLPNASILRLSKTIHAETEDILYRRNIFKFNGGSSATYDLLAFLQAVSLRAYWKIQFIILYLTPTIEAAEYKPALDFLVGCRGLKRLEIYGLSLLKIPKTMQANFGNLRIEEINFVGTPKYLVAPLKELVEGRREPRSKTGEKRANEERVLKIRRWGTYEVERVPLHLLKPRGKVITAGKIERFIW